MSLRVNVGIQTIVYILYSALFHWLKSQPIHKLTKVDLAFWYWTFPRILLLSG